MIWLYLGCKYEIRIYKFTKGYNFSEPFYSLQIHAKSNKTQQRNHVVKSDKNSWMGREVEFYWKMICKAACFEIDNRIAPIAWRLKID